jgi:hypothetical protein
MAAARQNRKGRVCSGDWAKNQSSRSTKAPKTLKAMAAVSAARR